MSLKKEARGVIRLGDVTNHGGKVISVSHPPTDMANPLPALATWWLVPNVKAHIPSLREILPARSTELRWLLKGTKPPAVQR